MSQTIGVRELLPTIDQWRAEGVGFGRAVVVRTSGSAPRQVGAVLVASDDGRLAGSVFDETGGVLPAVTVMLTIEYNKAKGTVTQYKPDGTVDKTTQVDIDLRKGQFTKSKL